jgi:hypothetical protein
MPNVRAYVGDWRAATIRASCPGDMVMTNSIVQSSKVTSPAIRTNKASWALLHDFCRPWVRGILKENTTISADAAEKARR